MFETDIGDDREHSGSFLYLSIPRYALRELLLSVRSRGWSRVNGTVQSAHRTLGGARETIRVEVWYGYQLDGKHYAGRLVRDTCLYFRAVARLMDSRRVGSNVLVLVNPDAPNESYVASGLGFIEPLGIVFILLVLLAIPVSLLSEYFRR